MNRIVESVTCFVSHRSAAHHAVRASVTSSTACGRSFSTRNAKSSCKQSLRSGRFRWYAARAFAAMQMLHHVRNGRCVNSCCSRSCWLGCFGTESPFVLCMSRNCSGSSGSASCVGWSFVCGSSLSEKTVVPVHIRCSFSTMSLPIVQSSWCSI